MLLSRHRCSCLLPGPWVDRTVPWLRLGGVGAKLEGHSWICDQTEVGRLTSRAQVGMSPSGSLDRLNCLCNIGERSWSWHSFILGSAIGLRLVGLPPWALTGMVPSETLRQHELGPGETGAEYRTLSGSLGTQREWVLLGPCANRTAWGLWIFSITFNHILCFRKITFHWNKHGINEIVFGSMCYEFDLKPYAKIRSWILPSALFFFFYHAIHKPV